MKEAEGIGKQEEDKRRGENQQNNFDHRPIYGLGPEPGSEESLRNIKAVPFRK